MKKTIVLAILVIVLGNAYAEKDYTQQQKNIVLENIGALSASNIFLTYVSIGMLADAFHEGIYKKDFVISNVKSIIRMSTITQRKLNQLLNSKVLVKSDEVYVKKIIHIYDLLLKEAKALKEVVETKKNSEIAKFQTYRKQAWAEISKLFNFKK